MSVKRIIVGLIALVWCIVLFKMLHKIKIKGSEPGPESVILERLLLAEENWREAVERRHEYIESQKGVINFKTWADHGYVVIWDLFSPSFDCPHLKKRLGRIGDGGKWVCGFELYKPSSSLDPCVVYSFGVSSDSSFESEILKNSRCEVFAHDMTVNGMGPQITGGANNSRAHFKKLGLGAINTDSLRRLSYLMAENGHVWIDILKIDIEGGEFGAFGSIMDEFRVLPFGQLQMEVHVSFWHLPTFYKWFERLESKGLRPFSTEINLFPCLKRYKEDPTYVEFSFINVHASHRLVPSQFVAARQATK